MIAGVIAGTDAARYAVRVISNTAISLDGRINTAEGIFTSLGSPRDLQRMSELRALADAVLVGGSTFRNWPHPPLPEPAHQAQARLPLWSVVVTRNLQVPLSADYLREPRIRRLFLTRESALRADFPAEAEAVGYAGPEDSLPIPWIVAEIARRGVQTLLVEAGGDLLFQFLAANLLDELFVTLCPKLIGGLHTPGLLGGPGFKLAEVPNLQLLQADVQGDEIFLHYKVVKK